MRSFDLDSPDVIAAIEDLALQVGEVDLVGVGDGELADAGGGEIKGGGAAEAARTDYKGMRRSQPLLAFNSDFREKDVAAVAEKLLVVQPG